MLKNLPMKKIALWLFVTMIASFLIAGSIFFQTGGIERFKETTKDFKVDQTAAFQMAGIQSISSDSNSTDVRLIPYDGSEIKCHLYGNTGAGKNGRLPRMEAKVDGSQLNIKVEQPFTFGISFSFFKDLILEVSVPKTYTGNIQAHTSSGDISISGLDLKNLEGKASSGNISIREINARDVALHATSGNISVINSNADQFKAELSSGNIRADGLTVQNATAKSSSGDVRLKGFSGGLKANSNSGEMKIEYAEFKNNLEAGTSSGDLTVVLPGSAEFKLDAKASSGEVDNDFPITITGDRGDHRLQGTVGQGTYKVQLRASSGDISITKQ